MFDDMTREGQILFVIIIVAIVIAIIVGMIITFPVFSAVVGGVLVVIAISFVISVTNEQQADMILSKEKETAEDVGRAIRTVTYTENKLNNLVSIIKNAETESLSAKARELMEKTVAKVNKLEKAVKELVAQSTKIPEMRIKNKTIAAYEESLKIAIDVENIAKGLEKEIDEANDLYDRAMKEEEVAKNEEMAEKGDAKVKYDVSRWYLDKKENPERYAHWLHKSAEDGYAMAQQELGTVYLEGKNSLKRNIDDAFFWLEKATEQGGLPLLTQDVKDWFKLFCGQRDWDFYLLLLLAVTASRTDVMEWLFHLYSDKNVKPNNEKSLSFLHIAASIGNFNVMRLLVDHGADVEAKDSRGMTPIFVLAAIGHIETMKLFVKELKANVEARNNGERTPIFLAVHEEKIDIIKCLKKEFDASILVRDKQGMSPMECAAAGGKIESIKCLNDLDDRLDAKQKKKIVTTDKNRDGKTPIFFAAERGKIEAIKCLHDLGADVNATDNNDATPLFGAAVAGEAKAIKCLHDLGADINEKVPGKPGNGNATAVFMAAMSGQLESIKCLIALGADINIEALGMTPLGVAVKGGHTEVAEYLRANGAW